MNEELLKLAYQSLKRQFDNISKDSWIWTDFFEDEKVGFDYFKNKLNKMKILPACKTRHITWTRI